jgi:hypothetical protein
MFLLGCSGGPQPAGDSMSFAENRIMGMKRFMHCHIMMYEYVKRQLRALRILADTRAGIRLQGRQSADK